MIANIISNRKLQPTVTDLSIKDRKLNNSLVSITQSYLKVSKDVRLNFSHYFTMEKPNKRDFQYITVNHASDVNFKGSMKFYQKCIAKPHTFVVIDTTLRNLLERI